MFSGRLLVRAALTCVAAVVTFYFALWPVGALVSIFIDRGQTSGRSGMIALPVALLCAFLVGRYVWRQTATSDSSGPPGLGNAVLRGAILVGLLGFALGFFGPLIFAPGANQGPLLGIFITGPLGVVVGAIGGALHWRQQRRAQ